ncbi:MAG: DUF4190 domain-containing protein [Actinomycetota bacterium]|nr:DUF4190 domain-containing protein [Actinomycetota bacterium]MDD5667662.1 DUF4190 domain-containing protein [Actinomycetota bacterium]
MKTCARCGKENPDDAIFCANCGGAFTPEEAGEEAAPPPYGQPPAAYPAQYPPPGAPYAQGPYPVVVQVNNSKATASLVLGIVGLFVCPIVCSVLAIILGSTAKKEIAESGGYQTGESNARAGIILGWIGLAVVIVTMIIWAIVAIVAATNVSMLPVLASTASLL